MKKINTNWIAIFILAALYIFSVGRFIVISIDQAAEGSDDDDGRRIVRVAHWQLEPGYREGMQWAIDKYNNLPHVREANVRVEQMGITERVYNQFMNVHLISGTAPDIAAKGKTTLIRGNAVARFYTTLGEYVLDPNPYNAPEYQLPDTPPAMSEYLATAPWRNTFIDGMQGGFDDALQDYYAVPVSTWGGLRVFYNLTLMREIKDFALQELANDPLPAWIKDIFTNEEKRFLPKNQHLIDWLKSPEMPETLGQFLFYCEAVRAFAAANNRPNLVPISGSSYGPSDMSIFYRQPFFYDIGQELDFFDTAGVNNSEFLAAYLAGIVSFDDSAVRSYYELGRILASYFPTGYLGLDREQAQRRFVLEDAAMISSGGWDAGSIFSGVDGRFEIGIARPPIPAEGERWEEYIVALTSEAAMTAGVPLAINKQSRNFRWALDFLRFLSSQRINNDFNAKAGWLPSIIGTHPVEAMAPFEPEFEGIPGGYAMPLGTLVSNMALQIGAQEKLFFSGSISYEQLVQSIEDIMANPETGIPWHFTRDRQTNFDQSAAREASLSVEVIRHYFTDDDPDDVLRAYRSLLHDAVSRERLLGVIEPWLYHHGDKPLPGR